MITISPLYELAEVSTAVVFRDGPPVEDIDGNAKALAIRDLVRDRSIDWRELSQVRIEEKLMHNCLIAGDVVLPSRGDRYRAWYFEGADVRVFPIGQINVVRVKLRLDSRYLAWYLNRSATQIQITGSLTGTNIKALTKTALLNLRIEVPSLALQRRIAWIHHTGERIAEIRNRINDLERAEITYLTDKLLNSEKTTHE